VCRRNAGSWQAFLNLTVDGVPTDGKGSVPPNSVRLPRGSGLPLRGVSRGVVIPGFCHGVWPNPQCQLVVS
jgi:hypothetical protein